MVYFSMNDDAFLTTEKFVSYEKFLFWKTFVDCDLCKYLIYSGCLLRFGKLVMRLEIR